MKQKIVIAKKKGTASDEVLSMKINDEYSETSTVKDGSLSELVRSNSGRVLECMEKWF